MSLLDQRSILVRQTIPIVPSMLLQSRSSASTPRESTRTHHQCQFRPSQSSPLKQRQTIPIRQKPFPISEYISLEQIISSQESHHSLDESYLRHVVHVRPVTEDVDPRAAEIMMQRHEGDSRLEYSCRISWNVKLCVHSSLIRGDERERECRTMKSFLLACDSLLVRSFRQRSASRKHLVTCCRISASST